MICQVDPNERLEQAQVAVWLNIPLNTFGEEVTKGVWDGTYVLQGNHKRFIPKLVIERQEELAVKSAIAARKKAA